MTNLLRRELNRDLTNHKYEISDNGVYFPKPALHISGEYMIRDQGKEPEYFPNLIPTAGLSHILERLLPGSTAIETWYLSIFTADATVSSSMTGADYPTTTSELTSNTEGYTEPTRPQWQPGAVSNGMVDSYATPAQFTIATATQVIIRGIGLHQFDTKGDITGLLLSVTKLPQARTYYNGDVFDLGYRISISSA